MQRKASLLVFYILHLLPFNFKNWNQCDQFGYSKFVFSSNEKLQSGYKILLNNKQTPNLKFEKVEISCHTAG